MGLAWRNLLQDKTRFGLSAGGVALAIMLILILNGFVAGMNLQVSRYFDNAPGSVVLVQSGTRGASSSLPLEAVDAARAVDGVASVIPVISQYAVLDLGQSKQYVNVIGYDPAIGGGPWELKEGTYPKTDDQVVLDAVLASRRGIRLNDDFSLMGQALKVVGLSDGTTTWMTSYLFMRLDEAQRLFGSPSAVSLVFVTPSAGVSPELLKSRLGSISGADAMLKSDLIAQTRSTYLSVFGAPLNLMAGIAGLVGTLVVGLVIYSATVERRREYGLLKAIGGRNRLLYSVVAVQATLAATVGAGLGIGLAIAAAQLIMSVRPQFEITVEAPSAAVALAIALAMALLAALGPAAMLSRLAPAEVFRR